MLWSLDARADTMIVPRPISVCRAVCKVSRKDSSFTLVRSRIREASRLGAGNAFAIGSKATEPP